MSMEIAQLCKSTHNTQLQQSIRDLCNTRNMAGAHTLVEPKLKVTP